MRKGYDDVTQRKEFFSERILFGLLIIGGYFGVGAVAALAPLTQEARSITRDVLMTVGPLLGVIVQAIWKTDKADKQVAQAAATLANKVPDPTPTQSQYEPSVEASS